MKTLAKTTFKLTPEDIKKIIRVHFNLSENTEVIFSVDDTAIDNLYGITSFNLTGATINMEVELENLFVKK